MTDASPGPRPVAAVFDLRRPASIEALRRVIGPENVRQFEDPEKPLVVLVLNGPGGEVERLAFAGESQLREFYLATLRINVKLAQERRIQFVLRDLAPALEEDLRRATQDLALELKGPLH